MNIQASRSSHPVWQYWLVAEDSPMFQMRVSLPLVFSPGLWCEQSTSAEWKHPLLYVLVHVRMNLSVYICMHLNICSCLCFCMPIMCVCVYV